MAKKQEQKKKFVQIVALAIAVVMIGSVVLAALLSQLY